MRVLCCAGGFRGEKSAKKPTCKKPKNYKNSFPCDDLKAHFTFLFSNHVVGHLPMIGLKRKDARKGNKSGPPQGKFVCKIPKPMKTKQINSPASSRTHSLVSKNKVINQNAAIQTSKVPTTTTSSIRLGPRQKNGPPRGKFKAPRKIAPDQPNSPRLVSDIA